MDQRVAISKVLKELLESTGEENVADYFSFLYGAFVITKGGVVVGANDAFIELIGYDKNELYGTHALDLITPKEHEAMKARFANGDTARYELELLLKSGEVRNVVVSPSSFTADGESYRLAEFIDVTEERTKQRKLELAAKVIASSPVVFFVWSASEGWPVEYVSPNISRFGFSEEEFVSGTTSYASIIHPDDLAEVNSEVEMATARGATEFHQEYRIRTKSGNICWVLDHTFIRRDSDGNLLHYEGIIQDNSDVKLAQQKLAESEKLFSSAFYDSTIPTGLFNLETGERLALNDAFCKLIGKDNEALVGKSVFNSNQAKDPQELQGLIDKIKQQGYVTHEPLQMVSESGGIRDMLVTASQTSEHGDEYIVSMEDITERLEAESKLMESERMFSSAFYDSVVPLVLYSLTTGERLAVNEELCKMMGLNQNDLAGASLFDENHARDQKAVDKLITKIKAQGFIDKEPIQLVTSKGEVKDVLISASQTNKEREEYICAFEDVTDRKQTERRLVDSEKRFSSAFYDNAIASMLVNLESGQRIAVNDQFLRVTGFDKDKLLSSSLYEFNHIEDQQAMMELLSKVKQQGHAIKEPLTMRGSSGELKEVLVTASRIHEDNDEYIISFEDVSDRISAERELKHSLDQLQLAIATARLGFWILDLDSGHLDWNDQLLEIYGLSREEFNSDMEAWRDQVDPEDLTAADSRLGEIMEGKVVYGVEFRITRKDGSLRNIEASGTPIYDSDNKIIKLFGINRDVTDEKNTLFECNRNKELLEVVGEMAKIGGWSVDLRTMESFFTKQTYAIYGLPVGKKPHMEKNLNYFPMPGKQQVEQAFQRATGKLESFDLEVPFIDAKGKELWVRTQGKPVLVEGKAQQLIGAIQDISERKQSEANLLSSLEETVHAIARTVEQRDPYTAGHQDRTAKLAGAIAREMGLSQSRIDGLELATTIHDLGKIHVAAEILNRPGKLTNAEFELIKVHSQIGHDIIKDINFPWPVADIIIQHHERLDGSGYPAGLKGDEICLEAQILAVADMVEAISSHRPYRAAKGIDTALDIIKQEKGRKLNADAVAACEKLIQEKGFCLE